MAWVGDAGCRSDRGPPPPDRQALEQLAHGDGGAHGAGGACLPRQHAVVVVAAEGAGRMSNIKTCHQV